MEEIEELEHQAQSDHNPRAHYGPRPHFSAGPETAPRPEDTKPRSEHFSASGFNSVPTFKGTESQDDASHWLEILEGVAELYEWDDARTLKVARCKLVGHAQIWEKGIRDRTATWQGFRDKFEQRFGVSEEVLHQRLAECRQRYNETAKQYADRFQSLCYRLKIDTEGNKAILASFLRGLQGSLYKQLYPLRPRTLDDAIENACYLDEGDAIIDDRVREHRVQRKDYAAGADQRDSYEDKRPYNRLPPPPPRPADQYQRGGGQQFRGRDPRDPRPPQDAYRGPRPMPPPEQQRYGGAPPRAPPPPPPPAPAPAGNPTDMLDDITKRIEKLTLSMRKAGVAEPEVMLHQMVNQAVNGGPPGHPRMNFVEFLADGAPAGDFSAAGADGYDSYEPELYTVHDPEIYQKRVMDFDDSAKLPRKRIAVRPDDPRPPPFEPRRGAAPTARPDVDMREAPAYAPPRRSPPAAAAATPPPGAATAAARDATGRYRATRNPNDPLERATTVPTDALEEEKRITEEALSKFERTAIPLGTCLRIDPGRIYVGVGRGLIHKGQTYSKRTAGTLPGPARPLAPPVGAAPAAMNHAHVGRSPPAVYNRVGCDNELMPSYSLCRAYSIKFGGYAADCIIDSGASHSMASLNFLRKIGMDSRVRRVPIEFYNADGVLSKGEGRVFGLQVNMGGLRMTIDPYVSTSLTYNLILGGDFLGAAQANINYRTRKLEFLADSGQLESIDIDFGGPRPRANGPGPVADYVNAHINLLDTGAPARPRSPSPARPGSPLTPVHYLESVSESEEEGDTSDEDDPVKWALDAVRPGHAPTNEAEAGSDSDSDESELPELHEVSDYSDSDYSDSDDSIDVAPPARYRFLSKPCCVRRLDFDSCADASASPATAPYFDQPDGPFTALTMQQRSSVEAVEPIDPTDPSDPAETETTLEREPSLARTDIMDDFTSIDPESFQFEVGSDLSEEDKVTLRQFLKRERRAFAFNRTELGTCSLLQMRLEVGNARPVAQRTRRLPPRHVEFLKQELDELLAMGVIEESNGEWACNPVVVPKKAGPDDPGKSGLRFCIDYRPVNQLLRGSAWPLPDITGVLDDIGTSAKVFSTLDLMSGFWQVEIDPQDRDITGFTTPFGMYRWRRMPFGLKTAPATFQRLMSTVLRPYLGKFCHCFIDDVIVFSADLQTHMQHLKAVFDCLYNAGLKMKAEKCEFGKAELLYLGHVINGPKGIVMPCPKKAAAILDYPVLRSPKHVAAFLGLTGYYRKMVKGYSHIALPLTLLLKRGAKFEWGPAQERAFQELKNRLTTEPILRRPDFNRPFILQTDWSKTTVAACLAQMDESTGDEYAVAFASKKLNPTQQNWSATDGEAYAVLWAVTKFRPYLHSARFTLLTDHAALKYLMTTKNLTGKLARWALQLQEYDFDIQHRPGTANANVDALTRAGEADAVPVALENLIEVPYGFGGFFCETDEPTYAWDRVVTPKELTRLVDESLDAPLRQAGAAETPAEIILYRSVLPPLAAPGCEPAEDWPYPLPVVCTLDSCTSNEDSTEGAYSEDELDYLLNEPEQVSGCVPCEACAPAQGAEAPRPQIYLIDAPPSARPSARRLVALPSPVESPVAANPAATGPTATAPGSGLELLLGVAELLGACERYLAGTANTDAPYEDLQRVSPHQLAIRLVEAAFQTVAPKSAEVYMLHPAQDDGTMPLAPNALAPQVSPSSLHPAPIEQTGLHAPMPLTNVSNLVAGKHEPTWLPRRTAVRGVTLSGLRPTTEPLSEASQHVERVHIYMSDGCSDASGSLPYVAPAPRDPRLTRQATNGGMGPRNQAPIVTRQTAGVTTRRTTALPGATRTHPALPESSDDYSSQNTSESKEETSSDDDHEEQEEDIQCEICGETHQAPLMLLCDGCNRGFHTFCLVPPLPAVPEEAWHCLGCAGEEEAPQPEVQPLLEQQSIDTGPPSPQQAQQSPTAELQPAGEPAEEASDADANADADDDDDQDVWLDANALAYLQGHPPALAGLSVAAAKSEKRRARRRAARFSFSDGRLYKLPTKRHPLPRLVPTPADRPAILVECHDKMGHMGVTKTAGIVSQRYWWMGQRADIAAHLAACESCKVNRLDLVRQTQMHPLPISKIFHRVHIDCMGPYKKSHSGNLYIIVATDTWSKWVEAAATPDNKAGTTAQFLHDSIITRHGVPNEIITDRGGEWDAEFQMACERNHIQRYRTAAYKPTTNGAVEVVNANIRAALVKMINEAGDLRAWDTHLPRILWAYRTAPHSSTRYSPAFALYGRELTLPSQLAPTRGPMDLPEGDNPSDSGEDDLARAHVINARAVALQQAAGDIVSNMEQAKDKQCRDFARRRHTNTSRQSGRKRAAIQPAAPAMALPLGARIPAEPAAKSRKHNPAQPAAAPAPPASNMLAPKVLSAPASQPQRQAQTAATATGATPAGAKPAGKSGSSRAAPPKPQNSTKPPAPVQQQQQEIDPLAHLPELEDNELVYFASQRRHKLQSKVEGPYFFVAYNRTGTSVLVQDAHGTQFTFAVERLRVERRAT